MHVRLLVSDVPKLVAFYRDVVGIQVAFDDGENYADLKAADATLALFRRDAMHDAVPGGLRKADGDRALLVFGVESVDGTCERLRANGVPAVSAPRDMTEWGIRVAHFRDPEGNLIEVNEPLGR